MVGSCDYSRDFGGTGKANLGTEEHPEEAPLCVDGQGPGGTGKENLGTEKRSEKAPLCVDGKGANGRQQHGEAELDLR